MDVVETVNLSMSAKGNYESFLGHASSDPRQVAFYVPTWMVIFKCGHICLVRPSASLA